MHLKKPDTGSSQFGVYVLVEAACDIFRAAADKRFQGLVTAKEATDVYHLVHRVTHSDLETRNVLNMLFTLFTIVGTKGIDVQRAPASPMDDFEEAVTATTAMRE